MKRTLIFLACIGCGSGNVTASDLDAALDQYQDPAGEELIKPVSGQWAYQSIEMMSDTCSNIIDMVELGDGFEIDRTGVYFDLALDGADSTASCTVDTDQFGCTPTSDANALEDGALTLITTAESRGTMWNTVEMEGLHELSIDCEGLSCSVLEISQGVKFPCRFGVFFTAGAS